MASCLRYTIMKLKMFKTLWGHNRSLSTAIAQAKTANFDGIEGPVPADKALAGKFKSTIANSGLDYIAEITTAGSYVPDRHATLNDHIESFKHKLERSMELKPLFITCLGGCDAWPENQSIDFFAQAMEHAKDADILVSFETHRGRSFFNPWTTERIVDQLPDIRLTCDFSHWCVVCERLMDSEIEIIKKLAAHAQHIHARVGYDQGPQVPHPAAPEYKYALKAHQSWWEIIWQAQNLNAYQTTTMTPEFGPDGYLHLIPFSEEPVADLWEINRWMGEMERVHFNVFQESKIYTS